MTRTESTSFTFDDEDNSIRMVHSPKTPDLEREVYSEVNEKERRVPSLLAGVVRDVKDRWPTYLSDWTDSWDYRVIPSVVETYINNLLPAIAFAQEMFTRTDNSFGVNEVLLSSAVGGIVFGALGGQPLCIVGVTGPISIFNSTIYDIIKPLDIDYFGFLFWVSIWAAAFHLILATTNAVCLLKYVTAFPCDIFELFINIVYVEKGIRLLIRQFSSKSHEMLGSGYASIVVSLCMTFFGVIGKFMTETPLFTHKIRTMISDYSTFISVIFWSGFIHFGGYLNDVDFQKLSVSKAFAPTDYERTSWIAYHAIPVKHIFLALPLGLLLTILFYFDHNVSSLMAQRHQYKLKKPSTFHYDFALLGVTTGLSGLLGIPAPNGLIPQAPLHTKSLLVLGEDGEVIRCVEQRFTNTMQGLLMLGTMSGPLLRCLGQIPQAVLSSLFFIMGINGLCHSVIVKRTIWLVSDPKAKDSNNALNAIPVRTLMTFTAIGAFCAFVEFALTLSDAAIAFPVSLLITVLMSFLFPRFYSRDHLRILDEPVAEDFTLKNLSLDNIR